MLPFDLHVSSFILLKTQQKSTQNRHYRRAGQQGAQLHTNGCPQQHKVKLTTQTS